MSQKDPKVPAHYEEDGELHWDRQWRKYGRGYFVGQATKYLERYHRKGGLDDLTKAIHVTEKLKALEAAARDGTGPLGAEGTQPPVVAYYGEKPNPIVVLKSPPLDKPAPPDWLIEQMQIERDKQRWIDAVGGATFPQPETCNGYLVRDGQLMCPHCGTLHDSINLKSRGLSCARCGLKMEIDDGPKPRDKELPHPSHHFEPVPDYEGAEACRDCGAHTGFPSSKLPCPGKAQVDLVQPPIMTVWGPLSPYEPQGAGGHGPCPHCRGSGQVCCEWSTDVTPCPVCNPFGQ